MNDRNFSFNEIQSLIGTPDLEIGDLICSCLFRAIDEDDGVEETPGK